MLWLTDRPVPAGLWSRLRAEHRHSGWWPLLLDHLSDDPARPWETGELWPDDMSSPDSHDPDQVLARWWRRRAWRGSRSGAWPGLAPPARLQAAAGDHADDCAEALRRRDPDLRLGLVAVERGGDALTACGWQGAARHTYDTAQLSAVLRSWEDRFGARLVAVGYAEIVLSVAAPVTTATLARAVAAEHVAFCPTAGRDGLAGCAERLAGAPTWSFWWD